jgi:hypothetical protein
MSIVTASPPSLSATPKLFLSIPLHINPDESATPAADADASPCWHCDLSLLVSSASPSAVFAIGLDDPEQDRHLFCTSLSVTVKELLEFDTDGPVHDGLALHHQRAFAMLRRQQNHAVGTFLYNLSRAATAGHRLRAHMLSDDGDEEEPDPDSALTLFLQLDTAGSAIITPAALAAGVVTGAEVVEHVHLRFEFSRTARAPHVASLAFMMAAHGRLGQQSPVGRLLGHDLLRLVCDAYRLRLYECRRHVWSE